VQEPLTIPGPPSVPPEEPEPDDVPPLDPDEVDDPDASMTDEVPPEEELPLVDVDPPDPEALPELEPEPESFKLADEPPAVPIGPQATWVKRTAVGRAPRRSARLRFATS
jgi:hypothetical protein